MKIIPLITVVLANLVISFAAHARLVRHWTYDELRDTADLIVIATPIAVIELPERTSLPNIQSISPDGTKSDVMGAGLETTFQALTVLKGDPTLKTFVLHHYREVDDRLSVNGPLLVSFDPKQKKRFLLFLKREPDAHYTAVSGQTDPAISVKALEGDWIP